MKRFFNAILVIILLFFAAGLYGAWQHSAIDQYKDTPNDFEYCTQTFTVSTFFFTFSGDILGFFVYSCLFGRNAFELCRRRVRPNGRNKYNAGNLSDVGEYDDDKHYDYRTIQYDIDDPIREKIKSEMKYSINAAQTPRNINNAHQSKTKRDVYGGYTENLFLNVNQENDTMDDSMMRMNKDKLSLKKLRQSTMIEAEELISDEECEGIQEQKRILRLVWIMLICYWINILLVIFLGLFENVSCLTLMVSSTCMILLNDYEFGSTYWKYRKFVCAFGGCLCCLCQTYLCNDCFCGKEKVKQDTFDPSADYKYKENTDSHYKKFVRL